MLARLSTHREDAAMPYSSSGTSGKPAHTVGTPSVAAAARIDADQDTSMTAGPSTRLRLLQSVQHLIPTLSGRFATDIQALIDANDASTEASVRHHETLHLQLQRCRHTVSEVEGLLAGMSLGDAAQAEHLNPSHTIAPKDQRALQDGCDRALVQVVDLCRLSDAHAPLGGRDTERIRAYASTVALMASFIIALRTASGETASLMPVAMAAVALRVSMAELSVASMLCEGSGSGEAPYAGYDEHRQRLHDMLQSARQRIGEQELGAERNADTMNRVSGIASVVLHNIETLSEAQRQYALDAVPGTDGELGPTVHALFLNQRAPETTPPVAPVPIAPIATIAPIAPIKPASAP
jgi:hypothetical protein